jgi:hypothetical protein
MRPVLIAAAILALSLAGCASLAPYGPQMRPGGQGFVEQRIEADRFRVTYNGVGAPGPVADLALRRAAELTLAEGADWFEVTRRYVDGRPDSAGGVRPSVSIGAGSGRYGGWSTSGVGVGVGLDLSGPQPTSTTLEILIGRGPRPDRRDAYDAHEVLRALGG